MKRKLIGSILLFISLCALRILSYSVVRGPGVDYYVSNSEGNDDNTGTSKSKAWKTLSKVSSMTFKPGDRIHLKSGDVWEKETLKLNGNGTSDFPIIVSSYGKGDKPKISPKIVDADCVYLSGREGWKITNLELSDARWGVHLEFDHDYNNDYIEINNLYIHDMTWKYNSNPETYNHFSAGICVKSLAEPNNLWDAETQPVVLTNYSVRNVRFYNCDLPYWSGQVGSGFIANGVGRIKKFKIENCTAEFSRLAGYSFCFMDEGTITNVNSFVSGLDSYWPGSTGFLLAHVRDTVVSDCEIAYTHRHPMQQYDGCGFDFEGDNHNVTLKNSRIHHNDASSIFVFDNMGKAVNTNIKIQNCVIENFGLSDMNHRGGVYFVGKSTGILENNTINNTRADVYFCFKGDYSGFEIKNNKENNLATKWIWLFDMNYYTKGWFSEAEVANFVSPMIEAGVAKHKINPPLSEQERGIQAKYGSLNVTVKSVDSFIYSPDALEMQTNKHKTIRIKMKNNTSGTTAKLYWKLKSNLAWIEENSLNFNITPNDPQFSEYILDLTKSKGWEGTVWQFRILPSMAEGNVQIQSFVVD